MACLIVNGTTANGTFTMGDASCGGGAPGRDDVYRIVLPQAGRFV